MLSNSCFSIAAIAFIILMSRAVSSTSRGRSNAKSLSALWMASAVFSLWSGLSRFILAVCFSLIRFTVKCFLKLFTALVGHLFCFVLLVSLSPSDWLLFSHDSLLFCWNSCNGVVPSVSQ